MSSPPQEPAPEYHDELVTEHEIEEPLMGGDEQIVKLELRAGDRTAETAALIAAGIFVVVTWIVVLSNDPASLGWFTFHPLFQSLGITLFTYGILTLQPTSQPRTKAAGFARHQLIMVAGGVPAFVIGTTAMIVNKSIHDAPHFTSWHGIFGVLSFVWIVLQVIIGAGSVWFGGALFGGGLKAKMVYKYHRLSGYVLFPLLLFTAYLAGAWADWVISHTAYIVRLLAYTIAPGVILASVVVRVRPSKMKFF